LARITIIYADSDIQRLREVPKFLVAAGYVVWPCPGNSPVPSSLADAPPNLVILGPEIEESLGALVAAIWPEVPILVWPEVPILVLKDPEDYSQLLERILLALSKRGSN
jgi:hypothetical protein